MACFEIVAANCSACPPKKRSRILGFVLVQKDSYPVGFDPTNSAHWLGLLNPANVNTRKITGFTGEQTGKAVTSDGFGRVKTQIDGYDWEIKGQVAYDPDLKPFFDSLRAGTELDDYDFWYWGWDGIWNSGETASTMENHFTNPKDMNGKIMRDLTFTFSSLFEPSFYAINTKTVFEPCYPN